MPSEIEPTKLGMKYLLKEQFLDYQSCENYVEKNVYLKDGDQEYDGLFYKIDQKEYKVLFTYCRKVDETD
tara:strand:+ start:299 stop:508 length:210 start_codon:yes stop_codon:yes gene_type:complete